MTIEAGIIHEACGRAAEGEIILERGVYADYLALSRFHYRQGPPATHVLILRARWRGSDRDSRSAPAGPPGKPPGGGFGGRAWMPVQSTLGVLVVSMPTLNGAWRAGVWPGMGNATDRRAQAAEINARLRTISRVVVDPRFRGMGVASALVRAYLASPLTECTEAVAAMGRVCPFFESAGMTRVHSITAPRHARLARALRGLGIPPWQLLDVGRTKKRLEIMPELAAALERWDRGGRRGASGEPLHLLAADAACAVTARPVAYVHERPVKKESTRAQTTHKGLAEARSHGAREEGRAQGQGRPRGRCSGQGRRALRWTPAQGRAVGGEGGR